MNKFITVKSVALFFIIILLIIIGIIVSCGGSNNKGNNKTPAQIELDLLIFQIENKIINLDTLNDQEYIDMGYKIAELIVEQ